MKDRLLWSMIHRLLRPTKNTSFFIFGARGTGKSTFVLMQLMSQINESYLYYDLLDDDIEERFAKSPSLLHADIEGSKNRPKWVIIDEVQKVPRLLDVIQSLIVNKKIKFILTGSSARKLKLDGANLLAGRAFDYRLFPFSFFELDDQFDLKSALQFGMLPATFEFQERSDKIKYLKSYVSTYVKTEIQMEQLVRKLPPFRSFLEIAAQMNGKPLNFSKIAREVGVDTKTILAYFQILEDTFLGFFVPGFHTSLRKSILIAPKFYFFDVGVKRALEQSLQSEVIAGTSYYGETFEHLVMVEIMKLNHYSGKDYSISYFSTKEGAEVDVVLSRGKRETIFIEIKSARKVDPIEVRKLAQLTRGTTIKVYFLSQDHNAQSFYDIRCLFWSEALKEIFLSAE